MQSAVVAKLYVSWSISEKAVRMDGDLSLSNPETGIQIETDAGRPEPHIHFGRAGFRGERSAAARRFRRPACAQRMRASHPPRRANRGTSHFPGSCLSESCSRVGTDHCGDRTRGMPAAHSRHLKHTPVPTNAAQFTPASRLPPPQPAQPAPGAPPPSPQT